MSGAATDLADALAHSAGAALQRYAALPDSERAGAAALALRLGRPALAAAWAGEDGLLRAAALLRLGRWAEAVEALRDVPPSARRAVLAARAAWLAGWPDAAAQAHHARQLARQEGDVGALVAAVTLLGELELGRPRTALHTLAEGLKVAEIAGAEADAHLLAVLAHAQRRLGGPKGERTAAKALERSLPRSPARVLALLALSREAEAFAEGAAGELDPAWWRGFSLPTRPAGPARE